MTVTISDRFPALSPFAVRREKARNVFKLMGGLAKYERKKSGLKDGDQVRMVNGQRIIYRQAGDDWF